MSRVRVLWLLKRLGATLFLLYCLNLVAFILAAVIAWGRQGFTHGALAPAWLDWWGGLGLFAPLALFLLAAGVLGAVWLVRYWRAA